MATTEDDTILNVLNGCTVRYIKENKPVPGFIGSGNDEGITLTWASGRIDSKNDIRLISKKNYLTEDDAEKFERAMKAVSETLK